MGNIFLFENCCFEKLCVNAHHSAVRTPPGFPLWDDQRQSIWLTRFPICALRTAKSLGNETYAPIWKAMAWSFHVLYQGVHPERDLWGQIWGPAKCFGAKPLDPLLPGASFKLTEVRGDWKQHADVFGVASHWRCTDLCHRCRATKSNSPLHYIDFTENPKWAATERTLQDFLQEQVQLDHPFCNALVLTPGWNHRFLRFCSIP